MKTSDSTTMDEVWIDYVPWMYASVQLTITIIVSVMGAKYVRNELRLQKCTQKQQTELQIKVTNEMNRNEEDAMIEDEQKSEEPQHDEIDQMKVHSDMYMCIYTSYIIASSKTLDLQITKKFK